MALLPPQSHARIFEGLVNSGIGVSENGVSASCIRACYPVRNAADHRILRNSHHFSAHKPLRSANVRRLPRILTGPMAALDAGKVEATNLSPSSDVLKVWQTADAVCFDVDSTVCIDEGIDELADFCGAGEAVAAWTMRAMGGSVSFQDALAARLNIFKPSAGDVASFLANNPPRLSPGIKELVKKIRSRGAAVYLISGGFRQMIEPVAELLDIPKEQVFANRILFHEDGSYAGFDESEPTSRSGGKALAIEKLKRAHGYTTLVMIGDGATDLEARRDGGADIFIGYGGVQARQKVVDGADWFVYDLNCLVESLA